MKPKVTAYIIVVCVGSTPVQGQNKKLPPRALSPDSMFSLIAPGMSRRKTPDLAGQRTHRQETWMAWPPCTLLLGLGGGVGSGWSTQV